MRFIASYALFGNRPEASQRVGDAVSGTRPFYWTCLPGLVRAHHNLFPKWELIIHVDSTRDGPLSGKLRAYESVGLLKTVYVEENLSTCRSMLWRLRPLWDSDVAYLLSRDIDSMPSLKERRATEVFIESKCAAHCINDNPAHGALMMGGMVSFNVAKFKLKTSWPSWEAMIQTGPRYGLAEPSGGPDQNLMNGEIWPRLFPDICCHRFSGLPYDASLSCCYDSVPQDMRPDDVKPSVIDNNVDALIPFIGSPGYPVGEAVKFFDEHGYEWVTKAAADAERMAAS